MRFFSPSAWLSTSWESQKVGAAERWAGLDWMWVGVGASHLEGIAGKPQA